MNTRLVSMIEEFKNPSYDYNPVEMWFWNGDVDEEGITFQLEKFRDQNIVDFFIHPTAGFTVPYLSERYFELIKHVVKEAKRLGMRYWIYDEFDWPSGMAGGILLEEYPEYAAKDIAAHKEELSAETDGCTVAKSGEFLGAQSLVKKAGKLVVTDVTHKCDVTSDGDGVTVHYEKTSVLPEIVLFYFTQTSNLWIPCSLSRKDTKGVLGYVSMLRKEAIGKFIELTHERYKAAIGEEFGKTVKGVFVDEPTSQYRFAGPHPGAWDDDFFAIFEEEHGYSLKSYLYALFYKAVSPEEIKARNDYRASVKRLYFEAFIMQVADWCHANDLLLTGHFGGEEELQWQVPQGDMLVEAMYEDIPGLDCIFSLFKIEDNEFNIAGKLIASAAKFNGADRVLCETYTLSSWAMRFPEMRRIANRLLVLGANMIQYMGAMYSLRANGKGNGEHSYFNPLFKHYHVFHKYIGGISYLSSVTKPDAKVLMMNPLHQMIQDLDMFDERMSHPGGKYRIQRIYEDTVNALLYEGISFDIFSEDLINEITVGDRYIEAYGYRYECVVFPGMFYVTQKTAELIEKMKAKGVKMVFAHQLPTKVADGLGETGLTMPTSRIKEYEAEVLAEENIYLIAPTTWFCHIDEYQKILRDLVGNVSLEIESEGRVYIAQRSNEFSKVFFICNDENRVVETSFELRLGMKIYDAMTQEECVYQVQNGRVKVAMEPYEMIIVICGEEENMQNNMENKNEQGYTVSLGKEYLFETVDGNILPLSYELYDEDMGTWEQGGIRSLPGGIRLRPLDPYKLRSEVVFDYVPDKVFLNAEIYSVKKFRINGHDVKLERNVQRWSEADCKCEVTPYIKQGINQIELDCVADPVFKHNEPPFCFFTGDFLISKEGTVIAPSSKLCVGGWETQGYPYFGGDAKYTMQVDVKETFERAQIEIPCDDVSEVWINGEKAGLIMWPPHRLDITSYLKQGVNEIVICVTSTYSNLFEKSIVNGITDEVKIFFV